MIFLMRPGKFSKFCIPAKCSNADWNHALEHPLIVPDKDHAPLAIYGTLVDSPELDTDSGRPRVIGANVASLFAIQLDFDSGKSIDEFAEEHASLQWSLYTSYSHGFKEGGDRFRVIIPLKSPMPCDLLGCQRVRKSLMFNFPGTDQSCWDRGHWQIAPCIRSEGAPYRFMKNRGEAWGGDEYWSEYRKMYDEEKKRIEEMNAIKAARAVEVDRDQLVADMLAEFKVVPVGEGVRHDTAKRILAKYAHKGISAELPFVTCPWSDDEWQKGEWERLVTWASTLC